MMGLESRPGTLLYTDVMDSATSRDVAAIGNISRSLDFDDPISIQFTSVSIAYKLNMPNVLMVFRIS